MTTVFTTQLTFKSFSLDTDCALLHAWVTQPYAHFWGMLDISLSALEDLYRGLVSDDHTECYLIFDQNTPVGFLETYDPQQSPLKDWVAVEPFDRGFHILLPPKTTEVSGFSRAVFSQCLQFLFHEKKAQRLLVEPDCRNYKMHVINRQFGFYHSKVIHLPDKIAYLGICEKAAFDFAYQAFTRQIQAEPVNTQDLEGFEAVNRHLVKKALTEFIHERLLIATPLTNDNFEVVSEHNAIRYRFSGKSLSLEHLLISLTSITRLSREGDNLPLTITDFILDFADKLGLKDQMLANYLEEINCTVYSLLFKYQQPVSSETLVNADFQTVEQAMIEGHPIFIANSGRIGFNDQDFLHYSPEAAKPLALIWLAASKQQCHFSHRQGLSYTELINDELDVSERERFAAILKDRQLDPDDYLYLPVHPWQWHNKLQQHFAQDLANSKLVYLGTTASLYQPQQSIRTFFNQSAMNKRYIKVALSITNMGFVRGLSADYMQVTPAINDFIDDLFKKDARLAALPFSILKEEAAMGYRQTAYNAEPLQAAPFRKMLACLFRENPLPRCKPGQRLVTMASLLHVDFTETALLPLLIKSSGLSIEAWLQAYFSVYLTPLLQCFYRHKLVFMPHGENLILVLDNHVPVHAFMKDIAEEVCLLNVPADDLPDTVKRIAITLDENTELLSIFTDVFDDFFRFLAAILYQHAGFSDHDFWQQVALHIHKYQTDNADLKAQFEQHDLFAEDFLHSCLNRLQLGNNKQMVDLTDPAGSLQFAGSIANPIAPFKPKREFTPS